mgnify:CR=1 FL=1
MLTPRRHVVSDAARLWLSAIVPPLLWATHFLLGYALAELGCKNLFAALQVGELSGTTILIVALTLITVVLMMWNGWSAARAGTRAQPAATYRAFLYALAVTESIVFGVTVFVTGLTAFGATSCT